MIHKKAGDFPIKKRKGRISTQTGYYQGAIGFHNFNNFPAIEELS